MHRLRNLACSWRAHALALLLVLVGLGLGLNNGAIVVPDEGLYMAQASSLSEGSWSAPMTLSDLDSSGLFDPLISTHSKGHEVIPYANHPLYPLLLSPWERFGGYSGVVLLSAIGTWAAACAASLISRSFGRRFDIATLWVVGLGTQLFFYSLVALGHSVAAGLAGWLTLCLVKALRLSRPSQPDITTRQEVAWAIGASAAGALLVLVRSEGSLYVGAAAVAALVSATLPLHQRPRIDVRRAWIGSLVGVTGAVAYVINGRWAGAITDGVIGTSGSNSRVTDPIGQTWISILRPWSTDTRQASATMALVLVCCVLSPLAFRLIRSTPLIAVSLLAMAAVAAVLRQFDPPTYITGFLPAAPLLLVGLLLLSRREFSSLTTQFLLTTSCLTVAGIAWFTYAEGGASEWGGRFYLVVIPALAPLAVVALGRTGATLERGFRWTSAIALVVMTASVSVLSARVVLDVRHFHQVTIEDVSDLLADSPSGTIAAVATRQATGISRIFWRDAGRDGAILNGVDVATLAHLLPVVAARGVPEVVVLTNTDGQVLLTAINTVSERMGSDARWRIVSASAVGDGGFVAYSLRHD